jgi:hypothetical protein
MMNTLLDATGTGDDAAGKVSNTVRSGHALLDTLCVERIVMASDKTCS